MDQIVDNLGIPPLAGLAGYDQAGSAGIAVEDTVTLLKRYQWTLRSLVRIAAAHFARTPEWEAKCGLGLHVWLDAEHAALLRDRVAEMREPPHRLDEPPDPALERTLQEALRAESSEELFTAVYGVLRPALLDAVRSHIAALNPLFDHPTLRILRVIATEQEDMLAWGHAAQEALAARGTGAGAGFGAHIKAYLAAAGGVSGNEVAPGGHLPAGRDDGAPYVMDADPRRDERFEDPFNDSAPVYKVYCDDTRPLPERVLALSCMRLREMDVPEWMARIIFETEGRSWAYYRDLSRQMWDETRHAMMGEVAFHRWGVPFYEFPVPVTGSATLNREFTPHETHLALWSAEQGLMRRDTGKRYEWTIAADFGDPFHLAMQDYDWADEVLHAQIGRRHLDEYPDAGARQAAATPVVRRWLEAIERIEQERSSGRWWWDDLRRRAGLEVDNAHAPAGPVFAAGGYRPWRD